MYDDAVHAQTLKLEVNARIDGVGPSSAESGRRKSDWSKNEFSAITNSSKKRIEE